MTVLEFPPKDRFPAPPPRDPPVVNASLVDVVNGLLLQAKCGELTGLVYASIYDTGQVDTGWDARDGEQNFILLAATDLLHADFAALLRAIESE